ncbi:uncharacterized protein LOC141855878 [Brevipalpus obovatus]|uniref:uncharacterized protein LOC141855878 n=1 Tax=Brevipalpus obovatus TaxID=246614 RepID=UPI003D9EC009
MNKFSMLTNSVHGVINQSLNASLVSSDACDYSRPNDAVYEVLQNNSSESLKNPSHGATGGGIVSSGHQNHQQQQINRYSVLRDADSTVVDFGFEVNTATNGNGYQARNLKSFSETKARIHNLNCELKPQPQRDLRPHSTPATLLWLEENYEIAEGVCIPRKTLYDHYTDFCARNCIQPVNAASFGKIIRQQFPQLTTRRLGTRGQSRYHYYGIGIRETSSYYEFAYSRKATSSNSMGDHTRSETNTVNKTNQTPTTEQINPSRHRVGAILPDFPDLNQLSLPSNIDEAKARTFMIMYRTHCQRILDVVVRANFDEIQTLVLYFWQGIPTHLSSILSSNALMDIIGVCDCILYKSIANLLMPSALQTFPESLIRIIRKFIQEFEYWLKMALYNLPEALCELKISLCKRLNSLLKRQTSISHLIQAARMIINNGDVIPQMVQDWKCLNVDLIAQETIESLHKSEATTPHVEIVQRVFREIEQLLEDEIQIEGYFEWINHLVRHCIIKSTEKYLITPKEDSKRFLLTWSSFGARIIREMTINSAPSFGSFHLLRLLFDEYLLHILEYCQIDEYITELMASIDHDRAPHLLEDCFGGTTCDDSIALASEHYQSPLADYVVDQIHPVATPIATIDPSSVDHSIVTSEQREKTSSTAIVDLNMATNVIQDCNRENQTESQIRDYYHHGSQRNNIQEIATNSSTPMISDRKTIPTPFPSAVASDITTNNSASNFSTTENTYHDHSSHFSQHQTHHTRIHGHSPHESDARMSDHHQSQSYDDQFISPKRARSQSYQRMMHIPSEFDNSNAHHHHHHHHHHSHSLHHHHTNHHHSYGAPTSTFSPIVREELDVNSDQVSTRTHSQHTNLIYTISHGVTETAGNGNGGEETMFDVCNNLKSEQFNEYC